MEVENKRTDREMITSVNGKYLDEAQEDKLLQTVTDELCKHFKDPIDIECSYCEAAKAVIPLIGADIQREMAEWLYKWRGRTNLSLGTITFVIPMPELNFLDEALREARKSGTFSKEGE